jgi:hypothetical protein
LAPLRETKFGVITPLPAGRRRGMLDAMAWRLAKILILITPKRRWAQFRLMTLFAVVTALCAALAWLGVRMDHKRRERAAIKAFGVSPAYDWQKGNWTEEERPGPAWLRRLLGDDFFGDVVLFETSVSVDDESSQHLKALPALKRLDLGCSKITDQGAANLAYLRKLTSLDLSDTYVTDDTLAVIARLATLETLNLNGAAITDAGLVHIERLKNLSNLNLARTKVTDAGLVHLRRLPLLSRLSLSATHVANDGATHIWQLRDLTDFELSGATDESLANLTAFGKLAKLAIHGHVTDGGLAHISPLATLEELDLSGTQVTDEGLVHLRGITSLQGLDLRHTNVTDAGAARFTNSDTRHISVTLHPYPFEFLDDCRWPRRDPWFPYGDY